MHSTSTPSPYQTSNDFEDASIFSNNEKSKDIVDLFNHSAAYFGPDFLHMQYPNEMESTLDLDPLLQMSANNSGFMTHAATRCLASTVTDALDHAPVYVGSSMPCNVVHRPIKIETDFDDYSEFSQQQNTAAKFSAPVSHVKQSSIMPPAVLGDVVRKDDDLMRQLDQYLVRSSSFNDVENMAASSSTNNCSNSYSQNSPQENNQDIAYVCATQSMATPANYSTSLGALLTPSGSGVGLQHSPVLAPHVVSIKQEIPSRPPSSYVVGSSTDPCRPDSEPVFNNYVNFDRISPPNTPQSLNLDASGRSSRPYSRRRSTEKGSAEYQQKRIKNNLAVRKSREKQRQKQVEMEQRMLCLEQENAVLRNENQMLRLQQNQAAVVGQGQTNRFM